MKWIDLILTLYRKSEVFQRADRKVTVKGLCKDKTEVLRLYNDL